jgi:CcmD family protein
MQNPPAESEGDAPSPSGDGFVHVEGNATEQVSETSSLFVAYAIIWVILVAFALTHFRALRGARAQLRRLEQVVPARAPDEGEA